MRWVRLRICEGQNVPAFAHCCPDLNLEGFWKGLQAAESEGLKPVGWRLQQLADCNTV